MKNSILLAFLATDFCSGLQLFRLDNTFLLAFIAPSNFLTETISMRVTHITGPAHNDQKRAELPKFIAEIFCSKGHFGTQMYRPTYWSIRIQC